MSWPTDAASVHAAAVLRSVIVQRKAVTAADELLGALVAAVGAGLHPGEPGDLQ